jgi:hypothetical protein
MAYGILLTVYVAAMFAFLSFHMHGTQEELRSEIGFPAPWFVAYRAKLTGDGKAIGFKTGVEFPLASSWIFLVVGWGAYWVYWKLRTIDGSVRRWEEPRVHQLLWGALIAVVVISSVCMTLSMP